MHVVKYWTALSQTPIWMTTQAEQQPTDSHRTPLVCLTFPTSIPKSFWYKKWLQRALIWVLTVKLLRKDLYPSLALTAPLTTKAGKASPLSSLFHKTTAEKQTIAEVCKKSGGLLFKIHFLEQFCALNTHTGRKAFEYNYFLIVFKNTCI